MSQSNGSDRISRPLKHIEDGGDKTDDGPRHPKVERPGRDDIIDRMKRVDPDQAKRYRQRTGQ